MPICNSFQKMDDSVLSEPVISVAKIMAKSMNPANSMKLPHQNTPSSFNRKSNQYLPELGMSQLHHYVSPENKSELRAIHKEAYPTAIFYLSTILGKSDKSV